MFPPSVNFHINKACNYSCTHCFAVFDDVLEQTGVAMLPEQTQLEVIRQLDRAGFEKLTIAGGEPTLVKWLPGLFAAFSGTTMLVTNGSRLDDALLDALAPHLDWVVLSIDAADAEVSKRIGRRDNRGQTMSRQDQILLARSIRARGMRLKINTVVSQINLEQDMSSMIEAMSPERWKVLQVLSVESQNDAFIDTLEISSAQFDAFIQRHTRALEGTSVEVVPESCESMRGSYAMVDPAGRFFDNTLGPYTYSAPILDVGVACAFGQVSFDLQTFENRGGVYDWA